MPNTQPEKLREEFREKFPNLHMIVAVGEERDEIDPREDIEDFFIAKLTVSNLATREEVKRGILEKWKTAHVRHYQQNTGECPEIDGVLWVSSEDVKTLISQI